MLYCLNPHCGNRENPDTVEDCQSCQTPLLIHQRYHIIGFVCERHCAATELFYVTDIHQPAQIFVLKTLISSDSKIKSLFAQEQLLNNKLVHPSVCKGYDSFSMVLKNHQEIPCLVMEYIPGKNLEQWVIKNGSIGQEQAVKWLKQLLGTITYLHEQQVIHRDIKPSNIICKPDGDVILIDFGSAKQIKKEISNTAVGSFGFTAPEQFSGKAVTQSDFYALGKTLMYLLMGSDFNNQNTFVPKKIITPALHNLLREMTQHKFQDRPANTKKILRKLQKIEQANSSKQKLKACLILTTGIMLGSIAISLVLSKIISPEPKQAKQACDRVKGDYISCGETSFFENNEISPMAELKRKGMQQIRAKQWSAAAKSLKQVWQQTKDPEALIYSNNSKIQENEKLQKYTIAIAAGFNGKNAKRLNIIMGVAYAQTKAMESNIGLKVVLVNDQDNVIIAQNMAKELIDRPEIIAVIGHHVSDTTSAALKIYHQAPDTHRMALISPSSTSKNLEEYTIGSKHIFFRTVATDHSTANIMAGHLLKIKKIRKVAIFYVKGNSYSESLASELRKQLKIQAIPDRIEISILEDQDRFHLSREGYDSSSLAPLKINEAIDYAKQQGAEAFVVIPDASENAEKGHSLSMQDAINIVKASSEVEIVTGDSMAGVKELLTKEAVNRVTITSPWEMRENMESELVKFWQQETAPQPQIHWYAYTSYNAAQVIITTIQKNSHRKLTRDILREWISAPGFATSDGVEFAEGRGELKEDKPTLTTVVRCNGKYVFQEANPKKGSKSTSCPKP